MQNIKQIKTLAQFKNQQHSGTFIDQARNNWPAGNIKRIHINNSTFQLEH